MVDLNSTVDEVAVHVESSIDDEVKLTTYSSVDVQQSQVSCCDVDVKPSLVDESTAVVKSGVVAGQDSVLLSRLDCQPNGNNYSSDSNLIVKLDVDSIADSGESVAGSVGVKTEKSSDEGLDIVIKRETGVIENCRAAVISDVNMETNSFGLPVDCAKTELQVKTEIVTEFVSMETGVSDVLAGISTVENS